MRCAHGSVTRTLSGGAAWTRWNGSAPGARAGSMQGAVTAPTGSTRTNAITTAAGAQAATRTGTPTGMTCRPEVATASAWAECSARATLAPDSAAPAIQWSWPELPTTATTLATVTTGTSAGVRPTGTSRPRVTVDLTTVAVRKATSVPPSGSPRT